MTTNHLRLTYSPFWMCDNPNDNVGSNEWGPNHTCLETGLQPSYNHYLQRKNKVMRGFWKLIAFAGKLKSYTPAYRLIRSCDVCHKLEMDKVNFQGNVVDNLFHKSKLLHFQCVAFVSSFSTAGVVESKYLQKNMKNYWQPCQQPEQRRFLVQHLLCNWFIQRQPVIYGKPLSTSWGI